MVASLFRCAFLSPAFVLLTGSLAGSLAARLAGCCLCFVACSSPLSLFCALFSVLQSTPLFFPEVCAPPRPSLVRCVALSSRGARYYYFVKSTPHHTTPHASASPSPPLPTHTHTRAISIRPFRYNFRLLAMSPPRHRFHSAATITVAPTPPTPPRFPSLCSSASQIHRCSHAASHVRGSPVIFPFSGWLVVGLVACVLCVCVPPPPTPPLSPHITITGPPPARVLARRLRAPDTVFVFPTGGARSNGRDSLGTLPGPSLRACARERGRGGRR